VIRYFSIPQEEAEENQSSAFFGYGQEYSREDIQNAIDKGEKILKDTNGHGTFITGIAAGSETEEFVGAAPEAGIIVVKLKPAKDNIRKLYGIPENSEAYAENDIMLGIAYVLRQVKEIRRPVSILIALGSNSGNHAGSGALASFIDDLGITKGIAISVAAGNEGTARHHFSGETPDDGYSVMEFNVSDRNSLTLEIWGSAPNIYSIAMEIPGGEYIERIPPRFDKSEVIRPLFGGGVIYVDYFLVEEQSGDELIMIRLINPADGLWKIRVYASGDTVKKYDAWLPISDFLSSGTVFTRPDPDKTLTNPSNANYPICVAAYNHTDGGLYINGSRGYTADNRIKPDICAPGVEVFGPGRYGGYVRLSGTSVAAAHSAGCAALIFQWNMRINPLKPINGNQIKQYFIRGAQRSDIRTYPNKEWGYGTLDLYNTFIRLRE
jgi:subtilisin family serine protease